MVNLPGLPEDKFSIQPEVVGKASGTRRRLVAVDQSILLSA